MNAFTVILPHQRNSGNDRALRVCLDCLLANTRHDFAVLISAAHDQPLWETINRLVGQAETDCCVFTHSDMFFAPGWDVPMLAAWRKYTFVTNIVVEPGAIGVYPQNVWADFGRTPETFRRTDFEAWCEIAGMPEGEGWQAPYMFSRSAWLNAGGLDTSAEAFPRGDPGIALFEKWKLMGRQVRRARSFVYHLQRWSELDEQNHVKRQVSP